MQLTTHKHRCGACALIRAFAANDLSALRDRAQRKWRGETIAYLARTHYRVPDSALCTAALELATQCCPDFLLNHSLRAYALGCCMAHKVHAVYDPELFFVGSILHDIGLTKRYDSGQAFELDGAQAAHAFCLAHGTGQDAAELVHEMVALHDAVGVAHRREPEIALLHYGAGLDVAGLNLHDVHPRTLHEVLETYPGLGFREGFVRLLKDQVLRKPDSYIAGPVRLGFLGKIRKNSLAE
jgi:hypothetical protein